MKRKAQVGDRVSIRPGSFDDDPWVDAQVTALLSVQFVSDYKGAFPRRVRQAFAFYRDEGLTWKFR